MIVELLRHLLISCPPRLKRFGVLHDLIALEQRAKRQAQAWAPHRAQCQHVIAAMVDAVVPQGAKADRVVVAGSGLLLEIPLDLLAERFSHVVLVDLFHMPAVRRRAASLPGVEIVAHDLSGVFDRLESDLRRGHLPIPVPVLPQAEGANLILSVNCLSQLAGIPLALADAVGGFEPAQLAAWERHFITTHCEALHRQVANASPVGLLSDVERLYLPVGKGASAEQTPRERQDLMRGCSLPPLAMPGSQAPEEWLWDLAPAPEESRHWSVQHRMRAGLLQP